MDYIYTIEFKTKQYKTVGSIYIGTNISCNAAAYKVIKEMDLSEYVNNPKVNKVWIMVNGERQATYNIKEFIK